MKNVLLYKPKTEKVENKVRLISKKGEKIGERTVMDRTLIKFQTADDDYIISRKLYMEEVESKEEKKKPGPKPKDEPGKNDVTKTEE